MAIWYIQLIAKYDKSNWPDDDGDDHDWAYDDCDDDDDDIILGVFCMASWYIQLIAKYDKSQIGQRSADWWIYLGS